MESAGQWVVHFQECNGFLMWPFWRLFSPIIRQNRGVLWSLPDLTWPGAEMYKFHSFLNKKIINIIFESKFVFN